MLLFFKPQSGKQLLKSIQNNELENAPKKKKLNALSVYDSKKYQTLVSDLFILNNSMSCSFTVFSFTNDKSKHGPGAASRNAAAHGCGL